MKVTVVWATPELQDLVELEVPDGTSVADAVERSGLLLRYRVDQASVGFAVYGRRASAHTRLADHDRVELTRPLAADPKELRGRRAGTRPVSRR